MQLKIKKDQKDVKGMLGGQKAVAFSVHARVFLDDEESKLCRKYFPQDEVISTWIRPSDNVKTEITLGKLLNGHLFTCTKLKDILSVEQELRSATQDLHIYLETASSFGGEECFELPERV